MRLTRHTDFALRLLMDLAERERHGGEDQRVSIADVATDQDISRTHLMKITSELAHAGFITATPGRGGGIQLARQPEDISLGAIYRVMEGQCALVDCDGCRLIDRCRLTRVLNEALLAFEHVLDRYTLADALKEPHELAWAGLREHGRAGVE